MTELGERIMAEARAAKEEMVSFLGELASMESPSDVPESQKAVQDYLARALEGLGFGVRRISGRETGGVILAIPRNRVKNRPAQLLLGHCDTVWPVGTLDIMPLVREGERLRGPGVFDMKGGLTQIVMALRILERTGLEPTVTPVVLVNSDEEIGSPESKNLIRLVSRRVIRAFVPEPGMGEEGVIKTVRKGWSQFILEVKGKAAHAGLDPTGGASAILALSQLVQDLHAMTNLDRGITVNVGVISGGTRSNVIAPSARAEVDLRVLSNADAREMQERILGLSTSVPGTTVKITVQSTVPPLEQNSRNRALWQATRAAGEELGLTLQAGVAGGGSDGNTTSQYTATIDGIGAVGDGAHAAHEFLYVDRHVERCALLARLLLLEA